MCGSRRVRLGGLAVVVAMFAGQGCAAVTFQDARMMGKGKVEFTPTVALVGVSGGGESEALGPVFGANLALGVSEKVDLVAGYQGFSGSIGPKISLVQDRAALIVPFTIGSGFQVSPTAVFSVPLGDGVTFNPGAKVVWTACDGCGVLVGASAGLSLPFGNGRGVFRPEVGMLKSPGEPGTVWAFGVGLSVRSR